MGWIAEILLYRGASGKWPIRHTLRRKNLFLDFSFSIPDGASRTAVDQFFKEIEEKRFPWRTYA